jgi:hypothetical protein
MGRTPTDDTPTNDQIARIKLQVAQRAQQIDPRQMGQAAAAAPPQPGNRHSRALVNAVATGPGRATEAERRRSLARLLAQRRQREGDHPGEWTALAARLIARIDELEQSASAARNRLADGDPAFALLPTKVIADETRRLAMQLVEHFLFALDRQVTAHQVVGAETAQHEARLHSQDQTTGESEEEGDHHDDDH